ncbi:MAG: IS110 family transposase [Candidatus Cardinium sp.]|uniref:IS110 family transposase n=1 Tax=Cardinium endosymbiont of Dermatophagoides farinae TaxID=2597823 RepID=UPI0011825EFE|nr:IS110 family transposase [Cardinium endosymbiont of Dermatophagoides farinae]TSJ81133.1 IS110 family transposase [Cardinium endosymbiont of Dermatophagoides farinae]UWW97178.1 MAG: IS110 family transposase [Candidatus Cardinium sp.]
MKYIGIDISKSSFVSAFRKGEGYTTTTYTNDPDGIAVFLAQLDQSLHHCILEATGNYGALLVEMLLESEIAVSVINPKQIKHFARVMQHTTKTDKIDAKLIALYGSKMEPKPYTIPSESIQALKQQKTLLSQLKKQLTMSYNLLESFSVLPKTDDISLTMLKSTIAYQEDQIAVLEQKMLSITEEAYQDLYKRISSIKGIGDRTAIELIVSIGGGSHFQSAKQFSKYVGLAPVYEHSGSSIRKKGHINRHGNPGLRSLLYMASWSAIRFNKACKAFYERLKERGKPSKLALIAVANKLIRQVFAIMRDNTFYVDGHLSKLKVNH